MNKDAPVIEYRLLEHYYIENKDVYEPILVELLNKSKLKKDYGDFKWIKNQSCRQPDAVSEQGYSVDFKLLISQDMCEFRNLTKLKKIKIDTGGFFVVGSETKEATVVSLFNALRAIDEAKLIKMRTEIDKFSKAVVHFFDKVISKEKNIVLFNPLYLDTIDKDLSEKDKFTVILNELSETTRFIYQFRSSNYPNCQTYFIYIISRRKITDHIFVISQFTSEGLKVIDTVNVFELNTMIKLYNDNWW